MKPACRFHGHLFVFLSVTSDSPNNKTTHCHFNSIGKLISDVFPLNVISDILNKLGAKTVGNCEL